jgi:hypothetical protein
MLERGADINEAGGAVALSPQAAASGWDEAEHKMHIHQGQDGRWNDRDWTALMQAAHFNHAPACASLVMRGASTAPRSRWGLRAAELAREDPSRGLLAFAAGDQLGRAAPPPEVLRDLLAHAPTAFRARCKAALLCFARLGGERLEQRLVDRIIGLGAGDWILEQREARRA